MSVVKSRVKLRCKSESYGTYIYTIGIVSTMHAEWTGHGMGAGRGAAEMTAKRSQQIIFTPRAASDYPADCRADRSALGELLLHKFDILRNCSPVETSTAMPGGGHHSCCRRSQPDPPCILSLDSSFYPFCKNIFPLFYLSPTPWLQNHPSPQLTPKTSNHPLTPSSTTTLLQRPLASSSSTHSCFSSFCQAFFSLPTGF